MGRHHWRRSDHCINCSPVGASTIIPIRGNSLEHVMNASIARDRSGPGSSIATTGTKADHAPDMPSLAGAFDCSCCRTHLCNWLAFTPAFRARPDSDAPGSRHASTSRRLSAGSKLRLPPTPTRVTRKGKKGQVIMGHGLRPQVGLRTQS